MSAPSEYRVTVEILDADGQTIYRDVLLSSVESNGDTDPGFPGDVVCALDEMQEEAAQMQEDDAEGTCEDCGTRLDVEGFCPPCSAMAADFEERAYGSPTREERGYPPASDDLPRWLP